MASAFRAGIIRKTRKSPKPRSRRWAGNIPTAIVTGAGAGIGLATAQLLRTRGWHVLGADLQGVSTPIDVTDDDALAALVTGADDLRAIVHCAALFPRIELSSTQLGDYDRVMAVNLRAAVSLTLLAAEAMPQGGSLVFLTSGSGLISMAADPFQRGFALYGASKAALDRWVAGVAPELADRSIFASTITPGAFVETAGLAKIGVAPGPGDATISVEHVAQAVARLAEDRSGAFSGQRLNAVQFGDSWT